MNSQSQKEYEPTEMENLLMDKLVKADASQQVGVGVMAILEDDEQRQKMMDWLKENPHSTGTQMIEKAMELNPSQK